MRISSKTVQRGFTMIELLMVVAIIGLLSSIVLSSLTTARAKARDTQRLQDLRQVQTALETYRTERNSYPSTAGEFWGTCDTNMWGSHGRTGATGWIPNLAPQYIQVLPVDPKPGPQPYNCYVYSSNGIDYILMAYGSVETRRSTDVQNGTCSPTPHALDTNPANRPSQPTEADFAFFTPGGCRW